MVTRDQKQRLLQLTDTAVSAILCNFEDLTRLLLSFLVITDGMYYNITSHSNKKTQAKELHLLIMRLGAGAYEGYYRALHQVGQYYLAEQMKDLLDPRYCTPLPRPAMVVPPAKPAQTPGSVRDNSQEPDFPDAWPPPDYDPIDLTMRDCDIDDEATKRHIKQIGTLVYNLPHGKAIIINNKNFNGCKDPEGYSLGDRRGTDIDSTHMYTTLKALKFDVVVAQDCNSKGILDAVRSSARNPCSQACFVCVILSHGGNGMVYGVDGQPVRLSKIIDTVEQLLPNGPKVFIIQACQGKKHLRKEKRDKMQTNFDEPKEKESMESNNSPDRDFVKLEMEPQDRDEFYHNLRNTKRELSRLELTDQNASGDSMGSQADIFIALATVPGYVSWRNQRGSWFIQALVYVLNNWAFSDDIDGIFTRVQKLVSEQKNRVNGCQQVALKRSTLGKKLFFFPGITPTDVDRLRPQKRKC